MQVPDPELKKIFGKWEWVSSTGGFAGKTITPATEGYTLQIEFNSNGAYKEYKSGTLTAQRTFLFSQESSIQNHKQAWIISSGAGSLKQAVSFSGQDTLMLSEQVHDSFQHLYSRIK